MGLQFHFCGKLSVYSDLEASMTMFSNHFPCVFLFSFPFFTCMPNWTCPKTAESFANQVPLKSTDCFLISEPPKQREPQRIPQEHNQPKYSQWHSGRVCVHAHVNVTQGRWGRKVNTIEPAGESRACPFQSLQLLVIKLNTHLTTATWLLFLRHVEGL